MIVGYGDIASVLMDRDGALLFASGVSNSSCCDHLKFQREIDLLMSQDKNLCCFYFSSINVEKKNTSYFRHKFIMEEIVRDNFPNYNIVRLGNILWGTNPFTFINYLKDRKRKGMPYKVKDEYKFVIDEKSFVMIVNNLPLEGQNTISVFSRMAKVKDLI